MAKSIYDEILGKKNMPEQLELFPSDNYFEKLVWALWEHADEIERMYKVMEKTLAEEPNHSAKRNRRRVRRNFR